MTEGQDTSEAEKRLEATAVAVLRHNDLGGWTKAAPRLYPHQWSWDSAFIAIGLAHLDTRRAAQELRALFAAQWSTGMLPHIVFNPDVPPGAYFPDAMFWDSKGLSGAAPQHVQTSGLCQPPVHAIAIKRLWEIARMRDDVTTADARLFLRKSYPRLFAWHRYLMTRRDPEQSGLISIYHPWESGMDNSPRWDDALTSVTVGDIPAYTRRDLAHVTDPAERPSQTEYDRYIWLVHRLKQARYDEAVVDRSHPFVVKDIFFSAVLIAANEMLREIAALVDAPDSEQAVIADWIERGHRGVTAQWNTGLALCLDYDIRAGQPIPVRTVAGFAPLIAGHVAADRLRSLLATLDSDAFCGHPQLRWRVPPSTSPTETAFRSRRYWRGPTWPVITWLLWWALRRIDQQECAGELRRAALDQLCAVGCAEYVEPFTGEPLGSSDQSWTAAVALDWVRQTSDVNVLSEQLPR